MCTLCSATATFDPARHTGEGVDWATVTEGVDAPFSVTTPYFLNVGDTFSGYMSSSDGGGDAVAVNLEAGQTYVIDQRGLDSGHGTQADPYLELFDSGLNWLAYDDDSGVGLNSSLTFTASYSGTYYLVAWGWQNPSTGSYSSGTYELTISETTPPPIPVPASVGTLEEMATFLTNGFWEADGEARHSFDTSGSNQITVDITALTAAGQQLARWAFEAWEMVANIDFVEVASGAQITFDDNDTGAYASYSAVGTTTTSAFVNVSTDWLVADGTTIDSYSFSTYIHEIGHALGLGHQGGYNGSATYGQDETFTNDSWQLSVMSYFNQTENTTTDASRAGVISAMMTDIIAIQDLYGAPGASGVTAGNTVWGANSNVPGYLGAFFATLNGLDNPSLVGDGPVTFTIYDQDGTDLLDLSMFETNNHISLWQSSFSDVGGLTGNLGIAQGTIIENAIAGSGNDTLLGNWADNHLSAGGGQDVIWASGGQDTVFGGAGNDEIGGGVGNDQLWGGDGADSLYGNEDDDRLGGAGGNDVLWGGAGNDELYGDAGADTLGGQEGNDTIWAGADNDLMFGSGGHDVLGGGVGDDTQWGGSGADTLYGFDGADHLYGADGWDEIWAGTGADSLNGGSGNDTLYGVSGDDTLVGGQGDDLLGGGLGADSFEFAAGFGADRIVDLSLGEGDRLRLDDALWSGSHGALSASQVISTFGSLSGGDAVLDFGGGNVLTLASVTSFSGLASEIDIF